MKILALMDDPLITIKLKPAIILIVAVICFLASLLFFFFSWFRFRKQKGFAQDGLTSANSDNADLDEKRVDVMAGVPHEAETSSSGDQVGASPGTAPDEEVAISSAQLELKLTEMAADLSQTKAAVLELSHHFDVMSASMKDSIRSELSFLLQQDEQRKKEDKERRELEETRQHALEVEKSRAAHRENLQKRLGELEQSDILRIATATKGLLAELAGASPDRVGLAKNFSDYTQAATRAENLRADFARFESVSTASPTGAPEDIDIKFNSFERSIEDLDKAHREVWFTGLLEEASRYPILQDKVNELKQMLKVEEVEIEAGSMPRDLDDFEVVSADGLGKRPIITEVLENGYRLTDTGTVLKRPKVRVHFEV